MISYIYVNEAHSDINDHIVTDMLIQHSLCPHVFLRAFKKPAGSADFLPILNVLAAVISLGARRYGPSVASSERTTGTNHLAHLLEY